MHFLNNLSVGRKMMLMALSALIVIVSICTYVLHLQKQSTLVERQKKLQAQVEVAMSIVKHYYEASTVIGEAEAKSRAMDSIEALRYDNNNYFWLMNSDNEVLMHPIKPHLAGKNMSQSKDHYGKHHWQEMSRIGLSQGSGFLYYTWQSPDKSRIADKMSFVSRLPEWDWIIGSGLWIEDIKETYRQNLMFLLMVSLISSTILMAIFSFIGINIVRPLTRLTSQVHKIAMGDMTVSLNENRKDEVGIVCSEIDIMLQKLQATLKLAKTSSNISFDMACEIASSSQQSATSVQSQHIQLEQLSSAMTEMTATITDVAKNAEHAAHSTTGVANQAYQSQEQMEESTKNIEQVSEQIAHADSLVDSLKQGVLGIGQVVNVIQDISEQTNLLALNAAIEAARAGEQGRGFAVVADEVRGLASRTQQSTAEIQATINTLTEGAMRAVEAMQQSHSNVNASVESVKTSQAKLMEIVEGIGKANDRVTQIAAAAEEQGVVAEEVNKNVTSINTSANEVSDTSERLADDSQLLANTSKELKELLEYFTVDGESEMEHTDEVVGFANSALAEQEPEAKAGLA